MSNFLLEFLTHLPAWCLPSFPPLPWLFIYMKSSTLHFTSFFSAYHWHFILRLSKILHDIQCDHVLSIVCPEPSVWHTSNGISVIINKLPFNQQFASMFWQSKKKKRGTKKYGVKVATIIGVYVNFILWEIVCGSIMVESNTFSNHWSNNISDKWHWISHFTRRSHNIFGVQGTVAASNRYDKNIHHECKPKDQPNRWRVG